jgi:drug/metabolite transporter (DMT)-like permease
MTPRRWWLPNLGSFWMLIATFFFAIMGAFVKIGAAKFTSTELVFYRSIFGLLVISLYIFPNKLPLRTPVLGKQMVRAWTGLIALILFFYAIAHLPLATAITLNYTSPLFLAALMPFMLKDERHSKQVKHLLHIALLLGFIGVVLLLQPTFTSKDILAGAFGLLSGAGAGYAYAHVKQLGQLNEPDWRTVFYFTLVSTAGTSVWMLLHHFTPIAWQDLPILIGLGISATIAQLALTRAYRTGNTLKVASLAYSTVIFASLIGYFIWHEALSPNELFAIFLITLGGTLSVFTTRNN